MNPDKQVTVEELEAISLLMNWPLIKKGCSDKFYISYMIKIKDLSIYCFSEGKTRDVISVSYKRCHSTALTHRVLNEIIETGTVKELERLFYAGL